jgi:hypothetical protein
MRGATWDARVDKLLPGRKVWQLAALFPSESPTDLEPVLDLLEQASLTRRATGAAVVPLVDEISAYTRLIAWRGTKLALPYRIYLPEPLAPRVQRLTSRQRQLLHCFYLRHHDGFVRQRHLEALLQLSAGAPADFAVPFLFSLVGEYVQEILAVLAQHLTSFLLASYVELIQENPLYWQKTRGRVATYWDSYYRRGRRATPRFRYYVGARLVATLHQALRQAEESGTHLAR